MTTNFDVLKNGVWSTLKFAHTAGDGSLKVWDASQFPSAGRVTCVQGYGLAEELFAYIAYSSVDLTTNSLIISGAVEGTTDVNMPARLRVELRGTAEQYNAHSEAINALEAGGGSGSVTSVGITPCEGIEVSGSPVTSSGTITLSTPLEGMVKAADGGFVVATDADYVTPAALQTAIADLGQGTITSVALAVPTGLSVSGSPITSGAGTITVGTTLNGIVKGTGTGLTVATAGTDYVTPAGLTSAISGFGSGTVTSVALAVPTGLTVSGSPITSGGTITMGTTLNGMIKGTGSGLDIATDGTDFVSPDGLTTVLDNYVQSSELTSAITGLTTFADVDEAVAAAIVTKADDSAVVKLTGAQTVNGLKTFPDGIAGDLNGTAADAVYLSTATPSSSKKNHLIGVDGSTGALYETKSLIAGSGMTVSHSTGAITLASTRVSSVALAVPTGLTVSGTPITSSGTITIGTTLNGMVKGDGSGLGVATAGTDYVTPAGLTSAIAGFGSGTVTSVALAVPTGLTVSGSPLTSSGTITIATALSGIVKGTGTGFTIATPGTDYAPATTPKLLGSGSTDICQFASSVGTVLSAIDQNGYGFIEKTTFLLALGFDLVTGTNVTNLGTLAGFNGKIVKCLVQANTNGASGGFSFTIKQNGTAIFSSAQSVAASTTTVQTYTTFSATSVSAGDVFTIDVTAAGTGIQYVNVTLFTLVRNS